MALLWVATLKFSKQMHNIKQYGKNQNSESFVQAISYLETTEMPWLLELLIIVR